MTGLVAGTYRLDYSHAGYATRSVTGLVLAEGGSALVPELSLEIARGHLDGFATLADGTSHEDILVEVAPGVVTYTDAAGYYRFSDLEVGDYLVSAKKGAAYSPAAAGSLTTVLEGTTATAPAIVLQPIPGRIAGSVRREGETDHAGTTASLWLFNGGTGLYEDTGVTATSATGGGFLLTGLVAGTYRLDFSHAGFVARSLTDITVDNGETSQVAEIMLAIARGSLAGNVTLLGESSHEGIRVQAEAGVVTFTDGNGAYLLSNLPVGDYLVSAQKGSAYSPANAGSLTTVTVGATATAPPIVLQPVPGTMTGTVERIGTADHSGINVLVQGVTVGGTAQTRNTVTGPTGTFSITDLTAGTYGATFSSAGFVSASLQSLVVSPGVVLDLTADHGTILLQPATGEVAGLVTLQGQTNHADIRAGLWQSSTERFAAPTNSSGTYSLTDVRTGIYTLKLTKDGYSTATVTNVVVVADTTTNIGAEVLTPQVGQVEIDSIDTSVVPPTVTLTGTYPDVAEARFCEDPTGSVTDPGTFAIGDCDWETLAGAPDFAPVTKPLSATACPSPDAAGVCDGAKQYFVRLRDGLSVESEWYQVYFVLDRQPPSGHIVINPSADSIAGTTVLDGGNAYTNASNVTVTVVAADDTSAINAGDAVTGVVSVEIYRTPTDGFPVVVAMGDGVKTLQGVSLEPGEGERHLYLVLSDGAGNVSVADLAGAPPTCPDPRGADVPDDCDGIFVDKTAPAALAFSINPADLGGDFDLGDAYAASPLVQLGIDSTLNGFETDDEDHGVEAVIANDSGFVGAYVQPLQSARTLVSWALTPGDGNKEVFIKIRDRAGNLSGVFSDDIDVDTHAPAAPLLVPVGAQINDAQPALTFSTVSDADGYELELSDDPAFSPAATVYENDDTLIVTTFTPPSLADGTYYWHVRAWDAAGHQSSFSLVDTFTVDTADPAIPVLDGLASPTRDATPTVSWSVVSDAAVYEVQLDNDGSTFPSPVTYNTTNNVFTFPTQVDGDYAVRVRAKDAASNTSAWSGFIEIEIDTVGPANPVLVGPAAGALLANASVTFSWNTVSAATVYVLQITSDGTFDAFDEYRLTGTAKTISLVDDDWLFRVGCEDAAGNASDIVGAAQRAFTVDTTAPNTPTLTGLASLINTRTPAFVWSSEAVSGATQYQLSVDSKTYTTANTTLTPADSLADGNHTWTVAAIDTAGNKSAFAVPQAFTVDATVPAAPTLSPVSPDPTRNAQPTFAFTAVAGATSYRVEWDTLSTFPLPATATITGTSTVPSPALADGPWYWQVFALDDATNESPASATDSFVVDTAAPSAPTLSAPANNATLTSAAVTFSWSTVADAATYRLQIGSDSGLTTIVQQFSGLTGTSRAVTLSDGAYYWRVLSSDTAGNETAEGHASVTIRALGVDSTAPDTPTLGTVTTPTNKARPTFSWSDESGSGATEYILDISSNNVTVTGTSYTPVSNLTDGPQTVRVASRDNAANQSSFSPAQSFTVDTDTPTTPVVSTPAAGATLTSGSVAFDWSDATDTLTAVSYEIDVSTAADFTTLTIDQTVTASNLTAGLSDGSYYWRVRAKDAAGNATAFQPQPAGYQQFAIDTSAPDKPVPTPVGSLVNASPTLSWTDESASGATNYDVEVFNDVAMDLASRVVTVNVTATSYTTTLVTDDTYYWHVQANDSVANASGWSVSDSFELDTTSPSSPAPATTDITPANSDSVDFDWTATAGATSYRLEIAYDSGFTAIAQQVVTGNTAITLSFPDGKFYWRVFAIDTAGNESAAAGSISFIIDTTPPLRPAITTDLAWVGTAASDPELTWSDESDSGAVEYD